METRKKIKTIAKWTLGITALLFVVLVVHIAMAKPVALDTATIQVSRIDFDQPLDAAAKKQINTQLRSIKGITSDSIIVKNNVVVYFHDNRVTNSQKVYDQLMAMGDYHARMFSVPAALASKKVCPAMRSDGLSYRFSAAVQRLFN